MPGGPKKIVFLASLFSIIASSVFLPDYISLFFIKLKNIIYLIHYYINTVYLIFRLLPVILLNFSGQNDMLITGIKKLILYKTFENNILTGINFLFVMV